MGNTKNEYDMEFFIPLDRKFHKNMKHSKELQEFVQANYSDKIEEEQMDIYRALLIKSLEEESEE